MFNQSRNKITANIFYIVIFFCIIGMVFLLALSGYGSRIIALDYTSYSRFIMFYMGLMYIFNNPFGYGMNGYEKYMEFTKNNIDLIQSYNNQVISQVLHYTPHNQFINTGVVYGIFILLLYIFFYYLVLKKLTYLQNNGDNLSFYL